MQYSTDKVTYGGLLVTLGIVFGDIGTSPLYVFSAITDGKHFDRQLIMGSLSCVFWTLLLIATFKYIYLALNADNKGEGGIFALYALLSKTKSKWIIFPALIGCAALISDGFITPAISISSAVEGITHIYEEVPTLPIVCAIVIILFAVQQFGTLRIGGVFGPIMFLWFTCIGILGLINIVKFPAVIEAINPVYAFSFLTEYPRAIWVLGAVFLCTTGAEALYSDLGHCGKKHIRYSWYFVLTTLLLSYFGQAAFCLSLPVDREVSSVFYASVPYGVLPYVIVVATVAAIIASQALITGIFTLVNEAVKLKLWPYVKVKYPALLKGQVYIPQVNYFLMAGCLAIIFLFKKASNMEAAYGMAIIVNMLMTSLLLGYLLWTNQRKQWVILAGFLVIIGVEILFFVSNLGKIFHGGWFTLLVATVLFTLLYYYKKARNLRSSVLQYKKVETILPLLKKVQGDSSLPYLASNLIFPVRSSKSNLIDAVVVRSLFYGQPKRAGIYWFLHLEIDDVPHGASYTCETLIPEKAFFVKLKLGFKEPHFIEDTMRTIHDELTSNDEIVGTNVFFKETEATVPPDFKFVLVQTVIASDRNLKVHDMVAARIYRFMKTIGLSIKNDFGLNSAVTINEEIGINVSSDREVKIERIN
ncbi:KUP/HAK/KT family potassium transporter [Flagellimonas flava]|uniref:KUP/HAK/KT family potassium transporter n=1 Tax=Flagellimonas flava TaxID=570519 RepID=UPI003D65F7D4